MLGQKMFLPPQNVTPTPSFIATPPIIKFQLFFCTKPSPCTPPPTSPQLIRAPLVFPTELLW